MDQKYYIKKSLKKLLINGAKIKRPKDIACTLQTPSIHSDMDLIKVPSATIKGYETASVGDSVNLQYINTKTGRGRVGKKIMNTLDTSAKHVVVKRKLRELTKNKSQSERIYDTGLSITLSTENTGLYQTSKTDVRRLTPTECERLQGFPDCYTEGVSDTQRYKTLGNAVTVNVVTSLINKMFGGTEYDKSR